MARLIKKKGPAPESEEVFLKYVRQISGMAAKHKAGDLKAIDVRNLTVVADAFVICSASSEPQMRAISNEVREGMRELGMAPLHSEGAYDGNWLVIDYGTVIFHLFRQEAREFYDLDDLWGDAIQIALDE